MNNLVDIEDYTKRLTEELKMEFGKRLLYVGLQGSYLRGEATSESDIDIMLVLDEIHAKDLDVYRHILEELGEYDDIIPSSLRSKAKMDRVKFFLISKKAETFEDALTLAGNEV